MTPQQLHDALKKIQEPKGYYFNQDQALTFGLLEGLLANKERYGHMVCPCRLGTGEMDKDRDVVCPCVYREPDVAEYGVCFCGLYVSKDRLEGKLPEVVVPERRPQEKVLAALGL